MIKAPHWIDISEARPESGSRVEWITDRGTPGDGWYESGMWWLPDKSMYCYVNVAWWRYLA